MKWQLQITDPSGETRRVSLSGAVTLGRGGNSSIILRDATAAPEAAHLWPITGDGQTPSSFWIRITGDSPAVLVGDLPVREARVPPGVPLVIGETRILLSQVKPTESQPPQPSGARHWLTCTEEGNRVLWLGKKAASTPLSIYLAGETGTGKEVLAQIFHLWSDRASGPFVPLNCGALPLALAESELFGHTKGAFTGAVNHRPGALMQAHGGTLFLDEIGDLPMDIQVKLLRFLENDEIRPVGADRLSRADVRILCATHRPLLRLVEEGKFRRDLYYRLASVTVEIPSLRTRAEDIEMLATRFSNELGRSISPRAMLRLKAHSWPGNVRELRHAIERASGLAGPFTSLLNEEAFEFLLTPENIASRPEVELGAVLTLEEMERIMLRKALRLARGNRAKAAKILGIARSTLFEMLKRHRICGPKTNWPERSDDWAA